MSIQKLREKILHAEKNHLGGERLSLREMRDILEAIQGTQEPFFEVEMSCGSWLNVGPIKGADLSKIPDGTHPLFTRQPTPVVLPDIETWRSPDAVRAQNAYRVLVSKALGIPDEARTLTQADVDRIVPAIDPVGLYEDLHHCEHAIYTDRTRIRKELAAFIAGGSDNEPVK